MAGKSTDNKTSSVTLPSPNYYGIVGMCASYFLLVHVISMRETIATPLVADQYAIPVDMAMFYVSISSSITAITTIFINLSMPRLTRRIGERKILVFFGYIVVTLGLYAHIPIGNVPIKMVNPNCTDVDDIIDMTTSVSPLSSLHLTELHYPDRDDNFSIIINRNSWIYSKSARETDEEDYDCLGCPQYQPWCKTTSQITVPQLATTYIIMSITFSLSMFLCQAVFIKMIGPRPQGLWIGLYMGCGSLARVTGPMWIANLYQNYGTVYLYGTVGTMLFVATLIMMASYKKMAPIQMPKKPIEGHENKVMEDTV